MKARRGGAEIGLERQNVLLKWIDEQLPIIASECRTSAISTNLGERKRSVNDTGHVGDSRRRVEFAEPCNTELFPVKNVDDRGSRLAGLPKTQAPRTPNTRHRRHRNTHLEACADGDVIHTSEISCPVRSKSPPKRTNTSRRDRARVNPVQTQSEGAQFGQDRKRAASANSLLQHRRRKRSPFRTQRQGS